MSSVRRKAALTEASLPCMWAKVAFEAKRWLFVGLTSIDRMGMTGAYRGRLDWMDLSSM